MTPMRFTATRSTLPGRHVEMVDLIFREVIRTWPDTGLIDIRVTSEGQFHVTSDSGVVVEVALIEKMRLETFRKLFEQRKQQGN